MTRPPEDINIADHLMGGLRRMVDERLPEKWLGRLGFMRGFFMGDSALQWQRLMLGLRHFREYRRINQALFYHRYATSLLFAFRLGVLEIFEEGPAGVKDVAQGCDIDEAAARTLLQILESQEILQRRGDLFETTPFASEFFASRSSVSLLPMLEVCETYACSYPAFFESARTGKAPPRLDIFNAEGRVDSLLDGVNYYLDQAGRELIARVQWPEIREFIVGSMGVSFSSLILSQFPQSRVTYGCLPHLVERIPRLRATYGVDAPRVTGMHSHGGEPTEDRWGQEAFDLVVLTKKMILDPQNRLGEKFAQKAYEVLNPGGVALFWETIHDSRHPTPIDRAMESFLDFGVSPAGPLLTRQSFGNFLEDIGFRGIEFVPCLEGATTFVVARK